MDLPQSIWANLFIKLLLWGLIIVIVFRILRFGFPFIIRNKKYNLPIRKYLLVAELSIWIFYLSWFTFLFLEIKSLFVLLIMGLLIAILFIIVKQWLIDIIAGIIFKNNNRLAVNDYFRYEEFEGVIKKFRKKALEIENTAGQIIYIPYHKLATGIYTKSESKTQASGNTFEIEISRDKPVEHVKNEIITELISLPWSSVQKTPTITLIGQSMDSYQFKITIYVIDRSYIVKTENHIQDIFSKK